MKTVLFISLAATFAAYGQANPSQEFTASIRPTLVANCAACHMKGPAPFLKAATAADMEKDRGLWRNVAAQLRNRTMPPMASKLTEEDRLHVASWVEGQLQRTACNAGDYGGAAVTRRLNRREYRNTVRDILGLDLDVNSMLPADGTGGAGFDTNGETLFIPPILMERYLEAAQQIVDRVVLTPPLNVELPLGKPVPVVVYADGPYTVQALINAAGSSAKLTLTVDGVAAGTLTPARRRAPKNAPPARLMAIEINLRRGTHTIAIGNAEAAPIASIGLAQKADPPTPDRRALHYRLLGMEPGERPLQPRKAFRAVLEDFLPKAFRRPVQDSDVDRFLTLFDRAAARNDPYEECVKLALKGVLVWPEFLFRVERKDPQAGIHPLSQYELATRLSYFLWSAPPDETLYRLAASGKLQDEKVLAGQVDRMLDNPRSRAFVNSFVGQWLGTQDIGGRVVPLLTELQTYYNPDVASDLREQPILLLARILGENRSLLDLLTANYTYMTERLAKYYQLDDKIPDLNNSEMRLVEWPEKHRAGVLGLAGVLAMTSRYQETSPVLRGAWVLDTMLGTPVPPPPPDVPALKTDAELGVKMHMREKLLQHRANPACAACHKLMDPIGFGLENFDWMGRWREKESDGTPLDASGQLPSGEKFNGPAELRQALLTRKSEFIGNLSGRVLGYALGRSLQDGDSCTVQRIAQALEKDNYNGRTLIREIVLSVPFRNTQGGVLHDEPVISKRGLDIINLNATKQDAGSHNNQVKVKPK